MKHTIQHYTNGQLSNKYDNIADEAPLEIRIEGRSIAVLMRQPNRQEDLELVMGFMLTEGVIDDRSDVHAIQHIVDPRERRFNTVDVILSSGVPAKRRHRADRELFASSSCGICGKATQERIWQHFPPLEKFISLPDPKWICNLPQVLRKQQQHFSQTGGTHAAALFQMDGEVLIVREDVGRHNAVDKVIGWAIQEDIDPSQMVLMVSGRVAFEIAQKTLAFKIPMIAAIGAPSSLAVDFCIGSRIQLVGFIKNDGFNLYTV